MSNGKKRSNLRIQPIPIDLNQKGQVLIESLLIAVISLSLLGTTLRYLRDSKTLDKVLNAAWAGVAQMAEYGNWPTANPPVHPNSSTRTRIVDPTK